MNEIVERDSSQLDRKSGPRIGNVVFNYKGYDKPIHAIPIVMENGEIVILTNIRAMAGRCRVVLQNLSGEEIKTLWHDPVVNGNPKYENAEVTNDDDNIYVFTSNTRNPQLYIFDSKNFTQISRKPLGRSRIQSVCVR